MATLRQKKAVAALVGNGGNVTKAMLAAGYTKATANTPQKLTESDGFKEIVDPIVELMINEREAIMKLLPTKRDKARFRDLVDAADKMTKNIQLLTGGKTSNERVSFGWEDE